MPYINEYEVTREYAGPEEGGRYFTLRTPVNSVRIRGAIYSARVRASFNRYLEANGHGDPGYWGRREEGYYRGPGQIEHTLVCVENHPAREWNNWQPYS